MPKHFSDTDKKKWLELYDKGKSEVWIAREHAKCDTRTVKKGIDEARRKQDGRIARTELVKDALRKHQDGLLEELDNILKSLSPPSIETAALSWSSGDDDSIFTKAKTTPEDEPIDKPQKRRALSGYGSGMLGLLREHLRNDKLWKFLARREKAYASHLEEKKELQRKIVTLLETNSGYKLVDKNARSPFIYSYTTGDLFFKTTIRKALDIKDADIENEIVADSTQGTVRYGIGTILAEVPGHEEECKKKLVDTLKELKDLPEVSRVVKTYGELEQSVAVARQAIEQILLLGLIPGQCQICRRLGM